MTQDNIEELILSELEKLKTATQQIEKAKEAVATSNQSFNKLKQQYELSQTEWIADKENISEEIESLKNSLVQLKQPDDENALITGQHKKMFRILLDRIKELEKSVESLEKNKKQKDMSYSAMNEMFQDLLDTKLNNAATKINKKIKKVEKENQEELQLHLGKLNSLQRSNIFLRIFIGILLIIIIVQFSLANN